MYCAQDGKVSIKLGTLAKAISLSVHTTRETIKELMACGVLIEVDGAKRHEPPIWQVHPGIIHSGKRKFIHSSETDFFKTLKIRKEDYILAKELSLELQQDSVYRKMPDGSKVYYMRLDLVAVQKKEPSGARPAPRGSFSKSNHDHDTKKESVGQDEDLPGQLSFDDLEW
jgi:hypothetical protein